MSAFLNQQLTNVGWDALSIALGGGRLTFYKMQAGSGTIANDAAIPPMTALVAPVCDIPITSYVIEGDGQITLFGNIASAQLDAGFTFKELGVFATIEDPVAGKGGTPSGPNIQAIVQTPTQQANPVVPPPAEGTALLYSYCNSYDASDYIPGSGEVTDVVNTVQVTIKIDQAPDVQINILQGQQLSVVNIGPPTVGAGPWSYTQANVAYLKRLQAGAAMVITEDADKIIIGAKQLTADLDLYVANGNPDISPDFSTIQNAIDYLGQYLIPTTLRARIHVQKGYYTDPVTLNHPNASNITIQGPQNATITATGIASITGSANNWSVRWNVPSTTGIAVNDWVVIDQVSGNPSVYNSTLVAGFFKVTAVTGTSLTVLVPHRKASFSVVGVTWAKITPITAIINPPLNTHGFNAVLGIGLFQYLGVVPQATPTIRMSALTIIAGAAQLKYVGVAGFNTQLDASQSRLVLGIASSGQCNCVSCASSNNQNGFGSYGGGGFDLSACAATHNIRYGFWLDGGGSTDITNGVSRAAGNGLQGMLAANSSECLIINTVIPGALVSSYNDSYGILLVAKGMLTIPFGCYYEATFNNTYDAAVDVYGLIYGSSRITGTRVFNTPVGTMTPYGALIL